MSTTYTEKSVRQLLAGSSELHKKVDVLCRVFKILNGLLNKHSDCAREDSVTLFSIKLSSKTCLKVRGSKSLLWVSICSDDSQSVTHFLTNMYEVNFPLLFVQAVYEKLPRLFEEAVKYAPDIEKDLNLIISQAPKESATT